MSKYKRIACSYYDVFESYATQKTLLKITYSDKQGLRQELISKIKTLETKNSEEFLITEEGLKIRLDKIILLEKEVN